MAKQRPRITKHCRDQMRKRKIRERDVSKTYYKPDSVVDGHTDDIKVFQRLLNGGVFLLRVVVNIALLPVVIITAYKTSQVDRYHNEDDNE